MKNLGISITIGLITVIAIIALAVVNCMHGERPTAEAPAEIRIVHADTLPAWQTAYMLNEIKDFRRFIEAERKEYQQFLARTYSTVGILISTLAAILTFLGIQSLKNLREKAAKELEQARKEIQQQAEAQYKAELNALLETKFKDNEKLVDALHELARKQTLWRNTCIGISGGKEEDLRQFEKNEKKYFEGVKDLQIDNIKKEEDWSKYHAVIHLYTPTEPGKDGKDKYDARLVNEILPMLKEKQVPLILYNFYHKANNGRVDETTRKEINNYFWGSFANYPFSLIANTYDAVTLRIQVTP